MNAAFVKAHTAARVEAAWRHILTPAKSGSLRSLDGGLRFELRGLQQTPLNLMLAEKGVEHIFDLGLEIGSPCASRDFEHDIENHQSLLELEIFI